MIHTDGVLAERRRPGIGLLLDDERSPSARDVLGFLLARCAQADLAVARIRLAALDFTADDLRTVRRCRVLLGSLDAAALGEAASTLARDPARTPNLAALRELLASGRLEIRSAGTARWTPDFAVLQQIDSRTALTAATTAACLVGWLGLDLRQNTAGPALTCLITGSVAITAAAARFDRLWADAYDVLPIVADVLTA
jgi:hypothetical protein